MIVFDKCIIPAGIRIWWLSKVGIPRSRNIVRMASTKRVHRNVSMLNFHLPYSLAACPPAPISQSNAPCLSVRLLTSCPICVGRRLCPLQRMATQALMNFRTCSAWTEDLFVIISASSARYPSKELKYNWPAYRLSSWRSQPEQHLWYHAGVVEGISHQSYNLNPQNTINQRLQTPRFPLAGHHSVP